MFKSSLHLQTDINGSSIEKKAHSSIVQNTQGSLSDYKLLHSVYEDGKYYVAISYENIPSFDKFIKKIKKLYTNVKQMPVLHNRYLANSSIATKLKKVFGKAISFELVRKDKKWFIKHQNIMQILDDKDFAKFFVSVLNDNISIMLNNKKRVLYNGDEFYFLIKSKKSGFVTLFDVYEDGTVTTLMRNIPVKKGVVQQMPDSEFESIPQAGLIDPNKETYDLYVALYSKKKLSFDSFAYAGDEITNAERYKNFDEFIELLDGKVFASLKVVVKPR